MWQKVLNMWWTLIRYHFVRRNFEANDKIVPNIKDNVMDEKREEEDAIRVSWAMKRRKW